MSKPSLTSVSILFNTPDGDLTSFHERTLSGVPAVTARQMVQDFGRYRDPTSDTSPHQLYRFTQQGEEKLIPLDFTEVERIVLQDRVASTVDRSGR